MFSTAKKVAAVASAKGQKQHTRHIVVDPVPGYAEVAALDACIKQLTAIYELKNGRIKDTVMARVVNRGLATKTKPSTIYPADGAAGGSAFLSRRASNRPLAESETEVLADLFETPIAEDGALIIPGITEAREKQPALLAVNPKYAGDQVMLARIDKALPKGIPDDFIIQQDAVIETIVAKTALDRIFSHDAGVVTKALDILANLVFRPVFKDMAAAWIMVIGMLDEAPKGQAERRRA